MERGSGGLQVVVFTKETGRMGTDMGKEENITVMETDTKEDGRTIAEKARECLLGQTAADTRENSPMTKRMVKELWYTLMVLHTMVN